MLYYILDNLVAEKKSEDSRNKVYNTMKYVYKKRISSLEGVCRFLTSGRKKVLVLLLSHEYPFLILECTTLSAQAVYPRSIASRVFEILLTHVYCNDLYSRLFKSSSFQNSNCEYNINDKSMQSSKFSTFFLYKGFLWVIIQIIYMTINIDIFI